MKKIVVHNGGFHADDLFATATILLFLEKEGIPREDVTIVRTRDKEIIETGDFILDVGGEYDPERNRFDHHQEGGAGARENGIPFAAFGLVWREFGPRILEDNNAVRSIDERLVQTIDALDNGIDIFGESEVEIPYRYILQSVIRAMHPTWKEHDFYNADQAFRDTLDFILIVLRREIIHTQDAIEGDERIHDLYEESKKVTPELLILDNHYEYANAVEALPEVQFVVKPGEDEETWKARAIRKNRTGFNARKLFPEEWAGKRGEELAEITGVPDALFVHNKRFIAIAESKEGALALAQKALKH